MSNIQDGPSSPLFTPLMFEGNVTLADLAKPTISHEMAEALKCAPSGKCIGWGIPYNVGDVVAIDDEAAVIEFAPTRARWFIFVHTSARRQTR